MGLHISHQTLTVNLSMFLLNGTFKGQGFKFKLKLSSDDAAQNISVEQAGYFGIFLNQELSKVLVQLTL